MASHDSSSSKKRSYSSAQPNQPINYIHRQKKRSKTDSEQNNKYAGTPLAAVPLKKGTTLKKQLRDVRRLVEKDSHLPDDVKQQKQAEIAKLQAAIDYSQGLKKQQKYHRKYKQIKFYDWRKADRQYRQIRKKLYSTAVPMSTNTVGVDDSSDMTSEEKQLRQKLKQVEADLAYIEHYPPDRKYISLYADNTHMTEEEQQKVKSNIAEVRKLIAIKLETQKANIEPIEERLQLQRTLVTPAHNAKRGKPGDDELLESEDDNVVDHGADARVDSHKKKSQAATDDAIANDDGESDAEDFFQPDDGDDDEQPSQPVASHSEKFPTSYLPKPRNSQTNYSRNQYKPRPGSYVPRQSQSRSNHR